MFETTESKVKLRGFALMSPEKRKEIASKGGKMAHLLGVAHSYTSETAREAGRKGGLSIGRNKEHMKAIGKLGGLAAKGKQKIRKSE